MSGYSENLTSQRIELLLQQLVPALVYGSGTPVANEFPLKVRLQLCWCSVAHTAEQSLDEDTVLPHNDTNTVFYFSSPTFNLPDDPADRHTKLTTLRQAIRLPQRRQTLADAEWVDLLSMQIRSILEKRVQHVSDWVTINTARFSSNSETLKLRRILDSAVVNMQAGIEFCRAQCAECELLCLLPRRHEKAHECTTSHRCRFRCEILDGHDEQEPCGLP